MQPTHSTFSDLYPHQTSQYYSHFRTQNPNPYPLHHLQIEPRFTTDPDPPGVDPYSIIHAAGAYKAHRAGDLTYSHAICTAPPPGYVSDLVTQNRAAKEPVQQYGNALYAVGATVAQDVSQLLQPAIPTHSTWINSNPIVQSLGHWKKMPKKTKIVQSAWCEICKIACNSGDILYKHKLGKKHIKNMEKLISSASVATTSTTTSKQIGPLEKPKKVVSGIKKKIETRQDLEIKRMKVLQGGAAANAVRTCTICNVVCNSDTVFRFHLAGQKHASMINNLQQAGVV